MRLQTIIHRGAMFTLVGSASLRLGSIMTAWTAIGLWAAGAAVVCCATALLMRSQSPRKVTIVDYIAGLTLPWGFAIGRGKLVPIVVESWLRWTLFSSAVVLAFAHWQDGYHRSTIVASLLALSWVIDGAVVLRLVTVIITRANSNPLPPGTTLPIAGIAALIAVSVTVATVGNSAAATRLALLLTGGPILWIGGGYLLMLLAMLTAGRHARWN